MTQEELANMLGVSMQAVSRWETSVTFSDITILSTIAYLFHVTTEKLLRVYLLKQDEYINSVLENVNDYKRTC